VPVRWAGLDAAGDTREPIDRQTSCEAGIAAFEQGSSGRPTGAAVVSRTAALLVAD